MRASIDVILTTGGTGVAPRDVTPEAVRPIADREIPGFRRTDAQRRAEKSRNLRRFRAAAGSPGRYADREFPGSPRGAVDSLNAVADLVPHVVDLLHGRRSMIRNRRPQPGIQRGAHEKTAFVAVCRGPSGSPGAAQINRIQATIMPDISTTFKFVLVPVTVTDRDGRFVTGLTPWIFICPTTASPEHHRRRDHPSHFDGGGDSGQRRRGKDPPADQETEQRFRNAGAGGNGEMAVLAFDHRIQTLTDLRRIRPRSTPPSKSSGSAAIRAISTTPPCRASTCCATARPAAGASW